MSKLSPENRPPLKDMFVRWEATREKPKQYEDTIIAYCELIRKYTQTGLHTDNIRVEPDLFESTESINLGPRNIVGTRLDFIEDASIISLHSMTPEGIEQNMYYVTPYTEYYERVSINNGEDLSKTDRREKLAQLNGVLFHIQSGLPRQPQAK